MNASIIDPLQGDFPELIEEYLEHGIMKCIAFNRRGTLLAAGCSDGSCVVWDFQTRGIAKELKDNDCVAAITSVCWSKSGYHILVSASDNSLILWNVAKGEKVFQTTLQQTPLQARLHPGGGSSPPSLCLVSPFSSAPFMLDLHTQIATVLPISSLDSGIHNKISDGSAHYTPTAVCFNKFGDLVYLGNSTGEILIIDHKNNQVCGIVPISGGGVIKNIVFSRNGQYLLTNSSDRIIRVYENLLPLKDSLKSLEVHERENENLKDVGLKCLSLFREFQDSITKVHWKAPCFSGDSAWVIGGSASTGEHKIYIWDRAGLLVKLLEGPKEALVDLAWHPVRPFVVSVSLTGLVYIWAKDYTENWSAFAPDFRELEENEEYVEQEDEFDLITETVKVKESCLNEDVEIDIVTVEKDSAFSDSDISHEELCYLPAHPSPDVSLKLPESNKPGSPLSVDSSETEVVENSAPEDTGGTHLKRRRRRSKKLLELQDLKVTEKTKASDCGYVESVTIQDGNESLTGFKEAKSPSKGTLRSKVWDHFEKVNKSNKVVAVCNYCGMNFVSGGVGTSSLRDHLRRKHAELIVSADFTRKERVTTAELVSSEDDESLTEYEEFKPSARRKTRSEVWNYFKRFKKPNNEMAAICNFCSRNFVAGPCGTNHLRNHLKRKHSQLIVSSRS